MISSAADADSCSTAMVRDCDCDVPFRRGWTRRHSDRTVREVVRDRRRRYALYYLREQSAPVAVEELAAQIAAWERRQPPGEATTAAGRTDPAGPRRDEETPRRDAVRESLRRTHIPYLVERDIVTYDRPRDQLVYDTDDATLELCLTNDPRTSLSWYRIYLALTAVSAVLYALVWVDVGPFGALSAVAVAGVVVVLFALASVVHWYDVYRWRRRMEGEPPDFVVTLGEEIGYRAPDENAVEDAEGENARRENREEDETSVENNEVD